MTRLVLVLVVAVGFALAMAGLRRGWVARARRQRDLVPTIPAVPGQLGADLAPELSGLYVGTTVATQWQNRIVVHTLGQRADAVARIAEAGVLIQRQGCGEIFIPTDQLIDARLEPALAGKVVGKGGLLVLRWRHGDIELDTGLRADDRTRYPAWVNAARHGQTDNHPRTGTDR